jgi:hypothetical protein
METMGSSDLLQKVGEEPVVDWRYYCEKPESMLTRRDTLDVLLESHGKACDDLGKTMWMHLPARERTTSR